MRKARQAGAHRGEIGPGLRIDQRDSRSTEGDTVFERFGTEQEGQRDRNRPKLVDRQMRDDRFRALGKHQCDPVAALDAAFRKRVGKPL